MRKVLFIIFFFFISINIYAYSFDEIEMICPIDGEKFTFKKPFDQIQFNTMLDGQPYGILISPKPVPKCPKDGFVIFRDNFSDKEIAVLKQYINSQEYGKLNRTETAYWLAYKIQEKLSAPDSHKLRFMQYATWEAYTLIDFEKYSKYANELIKAISQLKNPSDEDTFLKGELYRRLGDFEKAADIFNALKSKAAGNATLLKKIEQQIGLIEEGITSTQRVER